MNRSTSPPRGSGAAPAEPVACIVMDEASVPRSCADGATAGPKIASSRRAGCGPPGGAPHVSGGGAQHVRELVVRGLHEDLPERRDDHRDRTVPGVVHQLLRRWV